ncbi:hypothetical protein K443DRAFT_123068 [Laccaria amethystina LaAM-08-1]|uniref:DEAD/DEAH-box helicase domain-containing protein n=1 Tax=Laccaria amethystina LaAM-08-1 TaxID=1095629 RepID=A0A0C9XQ99_9AGAR|nr:hypothetical protein K443DRAFT_123068 [Laccaria amethystina LaAM-08-1]
MVPREMQFQVVLSDFQRKDCLIAAGTSSGKTLPTVLCLLLDDPSANPLTITISPLKQLQVTQESDFNSRFQIPTVMINEDTPRDVDWWNANIHDATVHKAGSVWHLIVTVEQLFKSSAGHFARLGFLIWKCKGFQCRIKQVNIDEAHCIHTAGLPLYGLNAFCPAWGMLDELKALLANDVIWKVFLATFHPHILKTVLQKVLKLNCIKIQLTSNHPNTMYTTHQFQGRIKDPRNYECFLQHPFDFDTQPHILIFFNDKVVMKKVAQHLDDKLPPEYCGRGVIQHYHSGMSEKYLKRAHDSFVKEGRVDALQCAGHALCLSKEWALFVVFFEAWALSINKNEYTGDVLDPDHPRKDLRISS